MKCIVENHHGVMVVKLNGRIDIGAGDIQLRNVLQEVTGDDVSAVVLDLAGTTYMDSAGLGELVASYRSLKARGVDLCLANVNNRVHDILTLTSLVSVFTLYDSEEDALQTLWHAA